MAAILVSLGFTFLIDRMTEVLTPDIYIELTATDPLTGIEPAALRFQCSGLHGKKRRARCLTGLNNVLLPTLFTLVNNSVEPESGVTILFNIVDNCEQCWQQNIVQSCFHQHCNNPSVFTCVTSPESSC